MESSPVFSGLQSLPFAVWSFSALLSPISLMACQCLAFSPVNGGAANANARDVAFNSDHPEMLGASTDPMFGSNAMGVPFRGNNGMARAESVTFSTAPQ